jgi:muramoyltetrapeptide carboxypeptidase
VLSRLGSRRMSSNSATILKPKALRNGSTLGVFAPASPTSDPRLIDVSRHELSLLGITIVEPREFRSYGYFAASSEERASEFLNFLRDGKIDGLLALRGGYGSTYILDFLLAENLGSPKSVIGYSDVTALQTFLWQRSGWVTFQGPMLACFAAGSNGQGGFDPQSFLDAVRNTTKTWSVSLRGETLIKGKSEGRILGGCLTILQNSLGTPWVIDTDGAILLLEDTHMKPYQVDRALMHLKQAGKFRDIRGIILGEFPSSDPPLAGSPTVHEVCERILAPLGVPVLFGAPVGHTKRPMLTVPLGIQARLTATGEGSLEFLEPAVID